MLSGLAGIVPGVPAGGKAEAPKADASGQKVTAESAG